MFCKSCKYELRGLGTYRCPECGRGFSPDDPATFRPTQRAPLYMDTKRTRVLAAILAVMLIAFPVRATIDAVNSARFSLGQISTRHQLAFQNLGQLWWAISKLGLERVPSGQYREDLIATLNPSYSAETEYGRFRLNCLGNSLGWHLSEPWLLWVPASVVLFSFAVRARRTRLVLRYSATGLLMASLVLLVASFAWRWRPRLGHMLFPPTKAYLDDFVLITEGVERIPDGECAGAIVAIERNELPDETWLVARITDEQFPYCRLTDGELCDRLAEQGSTCPVDELVGFDARVVRTP